MNPRLAILLTNPNSSVIQELIAELDSYLAVLILLKVITVLIFMLYFIHPLLITIFLARLDDKPIGCLGFIKLFHLVVINQND